MALIGCSEEVESPPPQFAEVEDGEWLPGGETTNVLLLGGNAFSFPAANLVGDRRNPFFTGNSFFNQNWVLAPSSTQTRDGLGPTFNARSCSGCHFRDGRGAPPATPDDPAIELLVRLSIPGAGPNGEPVPDPVYGGQIQPSAIPGVPREAIVTVSYEEVPGTYADGEPYSLRQPIYQFSEQAYGPFHPELLTSPRVAPVMIGLGLLDAIPEDRLLGLADPEDQDGDGISGRVNQVWDVEAGALRVGRFGWKAGQPSVRQQTAGAFLGDIGITSSLFPENNCTEPQAECQSAMNGGSPEIPDHLLEATVFYSSALAVPVRERWDGEEILRGKQLFSNGGCVSCHTPTHQTGDFPSLEEVGNQQIWPYTDLLLHDMGEELADGRPVFDASGQEWRTPPLWGLRLVETVNDHMFLLHDGRARGVAEAILWHGGEAEPAREFFRNLSAADRAALLQFVESL
ncbi:MAG: di-heme oxidoredictase family protein [Myxococcota bacterium]